MSTSDTEADLKRLRETLERRADGLDAATLHRVTAIRARALAARPANPWKVRLAWMAPLGAAAAAGLMLLVAGPAARVPPAPVASPEAFILLASQDADPLEDLELYVWLERNTNTH